MGHPRSIAVRQLETSDLQRVWKLHCENLPVQLPFEFFYDLLVTNPGALVATLPSTSAVGSPRRPIPTSYKVIGCVSAQFQDAARITVYICTLCIAPDFRSHGVARLLLDRIILCAKVFLRAKEYPDGQRTLVVQLHVQAANRVAHRFYIRFGFKNMAFLPSYYTGGDNFKPLDPSLRKINDDDNELEVGKSVADTDAWLMELETDF